MTPLTFKPMPQRSFRDAQQHCPAVEAVCVSVGSYKNATPLIARLLQTCRPSQIALFVVPIVINAVKRVFRGGASSNRLQEFLEGCKAKLDSPIPVVGKRFIGRICATLTGSAISRVFGCIPRTVGFAVGETALTIKATSVTPTRPYASRRQVLTCHYFNDPARTFRVPIFVVMFIKSCKLYYCQVVVDVTREVFHIRRFWMWQDSGFSHNGKV